MHAVLKVGGSLIAVARGLVRALIDAGVDCLIVPGGGPFADTVRQHRYMLDDTTAHWMATLAMNQYGWFLSSAGAPTTNIIDNVCGVHVLLPFDEMFAHDPLPHSWEVTSDSIATWVAHRLNANLVVATDVDGIYVNRRLAASIDARAINGQTCLDAVCPSLLASYGLKCVIINGKHHDRVIAALNGIQTRSTIVYSRE